MSNDSFNKEDLLQIVRNRAIETSKDKYGYGLNVEQKRYKKMPDKDGLSVDERHRVDRAKDKLTYGEIEGDYDDPFF